MRCAGCRRELEIGDQFIEGTAGDFLGEDVDPGVGGLMADLMGSGNGEKIVYCEDCTQRGGDFRLSTFYGDVDALPDGTFRGPAPSAPTQRPEEGTPDV